MPQYQGVWTLQQQMQALTSGQWATDPNFRNTTLLLQGDSGANGAQNNTFLDSSNNQFAITRNGNTTQGTFSPFSLQNGAWSVYFDGTSNGYLYNGTNTTCVFGTGTFCIEAWVYVSAYTANSQTVFANFNAASGATGLSAYITSSGVLTCGENSGVAVISGGIVPLNVWTHIAIVRDSVSFKSYINGVQTATSSTNFTKNYTDGRANIGNIYQVDTTASGYPLLGYISNLRVTTGSPVYTAAFTPSDAPLAPLTGTKILTCQSNRFVDNSGNNVPLSSGSGASAQIFSLFAPQNQWTAPVVGGSGYFDGTGDYLQSASTAAMNLGTSNFALEMWFYGTTFSSGAGNNYNGLCGSQADYKGPSISRYAIGSGASKLMYGLSSNGSSWNVLQAESSVGSTTITTGQWYHLVLCRTGTTISAYLNGSRDITVTSSASLFARTEGFCIGAWFANYYLWQGYINGFRFVVGSNPYDATQTTITVPTAPPTAITNTQLLLNYTNAGITDATAKNVLETVGNAQISTSVVKYGSGSMYFDGTGDWLTTPLSPWMNLGTSDFTMECWVYFTSVSSTQMFFSSNYNAGTGAGGWAFLYRQDNTTIKFTCNSNVSYEKTWVPVVGTWYHVAVSRANSNLRIFVNGIQLGTTSTSTDNIASASTLYVGSNVTTQYPLFGYMDDARITVGFARYTQNFIPPSVALPRQ